MVRLKRNCLSLHMPTIITQPKIEIDPDILRKFREQTQEEGQVIVHCVSMDTQGWGMHIRIWPTTYLFDHGSDHRSEMVHTENIVLAPNWQFLEPTQKLNYSLVFTGLPKTCSTFDLIEFGVGQNCFSALNIARNETDVYYIKLN